jgi:hypothetical protein
MALIPYWLRTVRIYVIFKAQEFYFKNKKKPEKSWFTWIRETVLVKLCLLFLMGMFMLSLGLFLVFQFSDAKIEYLPSYTVYMCFMNGMCKPDRYSDAKSEIVSHVNYTLYFLIVSNLIINCLFLTSIFKLRNIKSEFNIRLEILLTFLVWFVTTQLAIGLFIHQEETAPNFDWIYLILVARSIAASILTCARPLWLTQQSN